MPYLDDEYFANIHSYLKFSVHDRYHKEIYLWDKMIKDFNLNASYQALIIFAAILYDDNLNPRYIDRPRTLCILNDWLLVLKFYKLSDYLPAIAKVSPLSVTRRSDYNSDKRIYRIYKSMINRYSSLDRPLYEQYVLIAKKYNWDYENPDEVDNFYKQD